MMPPLDAAAMRYDDAAADIFDASPSYAAISPMLLYC